jgi:arylformamidase
MQIGPPPHEKGPLVWRDMDQIELDAAYDQRAYAPAAENIRQRYRTMSEETRLHLGEPQMFAYGPSRIEKLDLYRARIQNAPVFVFVHGGAWRAGSARECGYPAEMFVNAGASFVALDFINVDDANGDIGLMAEQVLRGIAWVYENAALLGVDRSRFYIGGHSSGGHLCGVALVTDWKSGFGLPSDMIAGGICMSGMFDMKPVRLSKRSAYVKFTDAMEDAMSSQRHLDQLRAPVSVTVGSDETPEFLRQSRDFVAAAKALGKSAELTVALNYNHFEMGETLGNPYGPNGRAALRMMNLAG